MKQLGNAVMMYAQDNDEGVAAWLRLANPGETRKDRLWTGTLQPYLKNGGTFPASGVFECPSWSTDRVRKAADKDTCDGPGTVAKYEPVLEYYSSYGMAFGVTLEDLETGNYGDGTPGKPFFMSAGSRLTGAVETHYTRTLSEIPRPSESALIGDGGTWVGGGFFVIFFGCEGGEMHNGGGNFTFLDGHAKWIARDPQIYTMQRKDGKYVMKYLYWHE